MYTHLLYACMHAHIHAYTQLPKLSITEHLAAIDSAMEFVQISLPVVVYIYTCSEMHWTRPVCVCHNI